MIENKQKQVAKRSGLPYPFNLDDCTLTSLCATQQELCKAGQKFSQSNIVRRAIRKYHSDLVSPSVDLMNELIELKRASKGVQ